MDSSSASTSNRLALLQVDEPRSGVRRLRLVRIVSDLGPAIAGKVAPVPVPAPAQGGRAP